MKSERSWGRLGMKSEWITHTFGDVCLRIYSGGPPSTKQAEYWNGEINWLSSGETGKRYIYDTDRKITELGVSKSSTQLAHKGDTVVASAGQGYTRGQASYLLIDTYVNQSVIVFHANAEVIDDKFLFFNLGSRYEELRQLSDGTSTRGGLSGWIVKRMEIDLPPLDEQKQIVGILSAIDNKIELNTMINENLEQQAQAYFVDLFITNADPNWKMGTVSDFGNVIGGGTPSKKVEEYYTSNGIAWITPKDLSNDKSKFVAHGETDITELGLAKSSATLMPKGTVLFSSRAPIGYIAIADDQVSTNQGFKSIVPFSNVGNAFVYYYLKENLSAIENVASGSTFKEVSGSTLKNFSAVIPDNETLTEFQRFCSPLFEQQRALEYENRYLATLRDTLLPKLMNGEIDVSQVQI